MKKNPFYGMSAAAMLFGCYMVSHALRLEPGQLGKLLTLIGVLQVYEALLVALGAFLVATRKAPRDGVTVLLLETLFLMDATLLATECVTAEVGLGAVAAAALAALAVAKLMVVRRLAPELLPRGVAVLLGLQAVAVLALPVVAALLAAARVLDARVMYAAWWLALSLPLARQVLLRRTRATGAVSRALASWSWVPALSVLLHLWSVGWIHQIGFQPAFLAPVVLGLALTTGPGDVNRQVLLPALALLLSVAQGETLGVALPLTDGTAPASPLRLTALAAASTWALLARWHRHPWLAGLAAASGLAGLAGPAVSRTAPTAATAGRWIARLLPRGALAWGVGGVVSAFVFLAIGTWRSLGAGPPPRGPFGWRRTRLAIPGGSVTLALVLAALAGGAFLSALDLHPLDPSSRRTLLQHAATLSLFAAGFGARALLRQSGTSAARGTSPTAALALVTVGGGLLFLTGLISVDRHGVSRNEIRAIADVRTVISAQAAYQSASSGYFAGDLSCLARPAACLPEHDAQEPAFLDARLASLDPRGGYRRSFHPGLPPDEIRLEGDPGGVRTWAYVATPTEPGSSGYRSFCGDSSGHVCYTTDGIVPSLSDEGTCDLERCERLP